MPMIIGLFLLFSVLGIYLWMVLSHLESRSRIASTEKKSTVQLPKMGSRKMRKIMSEFGDVIISHRRLGSESLEDICSELLVSLIALEKALSKTEANRAKIAMVEATHIENLKKLTEALNAEHYGSMVRNPEYWDDVESQKLLVRKAVETMSNRITDSVRQVYADRTFESKVNLETIVGDTTPEVKDFYRKKTDPK